MLVDSHCHLDRIDLEPFEGSLAQALEAARLRDVEHFLCVGISLDGFEDMMKHIEPFEQVFASCGVHPLYDDISSSESRLADFASSDKVVAIGETGLDYFYAKETQAQQRASFEQHVDVAKSLQKPLIIHTRDAKEDTLAILKDGKASDVGGVLHCFTEDLDMAKRAIDLGFYISISGIVTFKNASQLRDVVRALPLDRLLVETDSPYLAPIPYRGKTNQPAYVREVAEFIAQIKKTSYEELAKATTDNFFSLFKLAKKLT